MTTIKRIIASPFVLALLIIGAIWMTGERMYLFFCFGIEISHFEKGDRVLLRDIFDELKALRNEE